MKKTIVLFRSMGAWMATFSDPRIKKEFGTDTLPTAYTDAASDEVVLSAIRRMNPDATVEVK